ncbi:MAG: hypothetical protein O2985_12305, partial [Proteobacteria bacterium]|nr:hypothetical protein [Pseudomonadota bacterium]
MDEDRALTKIFFIRLAVGLIATAAMAFGVSDYVSKAGIAGFNSTTSNLQSSIVRLSETVEKIIPPSIDQNPCAQSRVPMDIMVH